jgi:hypothetical protein
MSQLSHMLTLFSATASGTLIAAIWQGTVLAAGVALCLHFMKGISAGVRSMLWTAVLLLVVLLHFLPLLGTGSGTGGAPRAFHADLRWSLAIVGIWAMLSLFRAVQLIHSAVGLRGIARKAAPAVPSPECAALLRTGYRSAELCTSADVDRPSVIGFFKPRVLIPQTLFAKLSASELEQIVMHEMEHLRRADDWTNLIQKLALVLFPLNPVLLWVERRLCVERELACDDHVLRCTRARKAYATCLVNLAEESVLRRSVSLALGAWERQSELGRRVRRILTPSEGAMGRRQMTAVASILAFGMLGGAITLSREPQLVSFAPAPAVAVDANLASSSKLVPVSLRERAASPKMVDTVFHEPPTAAEAPVAMRAPSRHPLRASGHSTSITKATPLPTAQRRVTKRITPQSASWVMLTDWSGSPEPPQVRLVVLPVNQQTYAAIQMANGWLIVQL